MAILWDPEILGRKGIPRYDGGEAGTPSVGAHLTGWVHPTGRGWGGLKGLLLAVPFAFVGLGCWLSGHEDALCGKPLWYTLLKILRS